MRPSKSFVLGAALAMLSGSSSIAAAQMGSSSSAAERFVVSGVVLLDGSNGLAWLQEPTLTGSRAVVLRPGQSVGPYRVTGIFEDRVELEGPNGKVRVPVHTAGAETVVAAAGAPQEQERSLRFPPEGMTAEGGTGMPQAVAQPNSEAQRTWRDQAERWKRQVEGQQDTPIAETPSRAAAPKPAVANPFANNPTVRYIPMNDPRRLSPFGSLLGGG